MAMDYDTNWQDRYREMVSSAKKALKQVRSGNRVFIGTGCGEPTELVKALTARSSELADVEIVQLFTKGDALYAQKSHAQSFTVNSFFIGQNVRAMIQEGLGSYTPILLSNIPQLFYSGQLPLDVVLIQVTPPNVNGKVSLGISVDIVKSAVENGSLIIAQVNPQMVWTMGDSMVDVYDLDILVPANVPLIEREEEELGEISHAIGKNVATLIPDNATIQFGLGRTPGFGRIPHAAIPYLLEKKNLGIHCEMITDAIIELIEAGVANGSRKSTDRGRIVTSFCMGTKRLYNYVDNNPLFCFRPTEYVNDFHVISEQSKMVAINVGQEIDLTGQVCTDAVDGKFYSGIGGLVDFNRGAARSRNGKTIIVIPSASLDAKRSRIVVRLSPGAGVSITRGTIHYVVTEYGIAYLHGKSVQERVMALISIAHPNFREQLFKAAVAAHYIRPEMADVTTGFMVPRDDLMRSTMLLKDGTQVYFRSVQPTDEPRMKDLLYDLSRETVYYRFMSQQNRFTHKQIQDFVYIDHRKDVAIVGTVPEAHGDDVICVGRYYLDEETNRAEVAFIIRDDWQNKGLGTYLYRHMAEIAKRNGIAGFTAEVLRSNNRMQTIFIHAGHKVSHTLEKNAYSFIIDF
ncbi:bifunctional acetyl-CoA hydrolase/transferase family protein/GNAT family N-acetyltransferase [Desulfopila inferna]|uniref:bifunctional acetyl-CoA hydrolase/transferase family protein/GNAT family N-acetyltransferase n=1 Tax=Desulfopila inferna TaxID=468528 RepID=UPI001F066E5C|nr:bifunctional acetyl-CoA hydrolase/transferase family protein/GNAT family N-acetyltransferase [Desulfopila inferna]